MVLTSRSTYISFFKQRHKCYLLWEWWWCEKVDYSEVKNEGNNWVQLNNGYITSQFYSVSIDKSGLTNSVVGGAQDNGSWRSIKQIPNDNWENVGSGDGCFCSNPGGGSVYTSSQNGSIYRIDSSGGFDYINKGGDANYLFVNPFLCLIVIICILLLVPSLRL